MTSLIVATDLSYNRNDMPIFSGIQLSVESGGILHLVGPNGVGKSTLLRVLAGLLVPSEGSVEKDFKAFEMHYIGHRLGIKDLLTVGENVLEMDFNPPSVLRSSSPAGRRALLGLSDLWDTLAKDLSVGQRQRLALLKLLSPAKIWLLDEPLTALDKEGVELFNLLLEKHCSGGGAAIIASHQTLSPQNISVKTLALGEQEMIS